MQVIAQFIPENTVYIVGYPIRVLLTVGSSGYAARPSSRPPFSMMYHPPQYFTNAGRDVTDLSNTQCPPSSYLWGGHCTRHKYKSQQKTKKSTKKHCCIGEKGTNVVTQIKHVPPPRKIVRWPHLKYFSENSGTHINGVEIYKTLQHLNYQEVDKVQIYKT